MSTSKDKIIKSLEKSVKEMQLIEAGKMEGPDFGTMLIELKAAREKRGGTGRGQGRKPAGYSTRIWVTSEEKKLITDHRAAEKKLKQH